MAGRGKQNAFMRKKNVEATLMGKTAGSVLVGPTEETKLETFYSSLSLEGREGYDAIISTNISTVLSEVTFISEANLSRVAGGKGRPHRRVWGPRPVRAPGASLGSGRSHAPQSAA